MSTPGLYIASLSVDISNDVRVPVNVCRQFIQSSHKTLPSPSHLFQMNKKLFFFNSLIGTQNGFIIFIFSFIRSFQHMNAVL